MNLPELTFPVIGLWDRKHSREIWELFWNFDHLSTCEARQRAMRIGMLITDSDGRCWEIASYRDLGAIGGFWGRLADFLLRQNLRRLDQSFTELPEITLDDVKARLCAAIQNNFDHWRDDEAIAGEDGPLRDEQELRDEMKAQVLRSNSVPALISNLWEEDLSKISAYADRSRRERLMLGAERGLTQ